MDSRDVPVPEHLQGQSGIAYCQTSDPHRCLTSAQPTKGSVLLLVYKYRFSHGMDVPIWPTYRDPTISPGRFREQASVLSASPLRLLLAKWSQQAVLLCLTSDWGSEGRGGGHPFWAMHPESAALWAAPFPSLGL